MDRKNFLGAIGSTAVCVCMGGLAACVKATTIPSGSNNNLSVDLNTQLTNIGDYAILGSIAVVRIGPGNSATSFAVLSTICPHAGFTVQYLPDPEIRFRENLNVRDMDQHLPNRVFYSLDLPQRI